MGVAGTLRRLGRWVAYALVTLVAAALLVHGWYAVQILWWRTQPVGETSFMAYRMAELERKNPKAKLAYQWVPYERISPNLKRAMIAAEDARFELFLSAFSSPDIIQWQSVTGDVADEPDSISASSAPARGEEHRVQTWQDQVTSGGWTLEIRGGVIEQ